MGKKEELGLGAPEATAPSARAHHADDGGAEAGPRCVNTAYVRTTRRQSAPSVRRSSVAACRL